MPAENHQAVPDDMAAPAPFLPPHITRRNVKLSAINQFFVEAAMTLSEATTVLPLLVKALGGSNFLAGLLPSLRWFGWLAPQFLAAGRMQRLTHFIPAIQKLESVRCIFYIILGILTAWLAPSQPGLVLALFFVLFMVTRFSAGSSAVARTEVVARIVPQEERATVISTRRIAGGVAGLLAGFVVRYVLDERVSQFPTNYAILLGISGISFGIAILVFSGIQERELPIEPRQIDMLEQIRRTPTLLRADRRYAMYIGVRAAASGLTLAAPFYILYATESLGVPAAMAGVYITLRTLSQVVSNMFWGNQCRRRGSLWVLRLALALGITAPLAVAALAVAGPRLWPQGVPEYVGWAFALVFLMQGLSASGESLSELTYLYEIAPDHERPTYYGLINTVLGPLYFLPALGGALLDVVGFVSIFAAAALFIGLAYVLAVRMDAHERLRARPAGQGLRVE
jgi:MFS family permease